MSELHKLIRKSSMWMIFRFIVSLSIGVFVTTYIIRSLTIKDYGIYTVLYSMIGYIGVLGAFGIPAVFRRFIPEALQKQDYSFLKKLIIRGLILRIFFSIIIVGIVFIFHSQVGHLLKLDGFINYFLIFGWGIVFYLEATLLTSVLNALFMHKYSVISSTLYTIFRGITVFLFVQQNWGIKGVLLAEVLSYGLWTGLLCFFYYVYFSRKHIVTPKVDLPLKRILHFGGFSTLNELGGSVLNVSTDFFIITAFLGPGAVAFYAFADKIIKMFVRCLPHILLKDVIRPAFFSKYASSGDRQHLSDMFNILIKIAAFSIFPFAVGIFILGDEMIKIIFKDEYLAAIPILRILIIFTVVNIFTYPTGLVIQAMDKVQIIFYSKIFAIYNLVVEILIISKFGVVGVVCVTCSAVIFKNLFCYYHARRDAGLRIDWLGLSTVMFNSFIMGLILFFLQDHISNLFSLILVAGIGGSVYLVAAYFIKAFSIQERQHINNILPKPVFVF